MSLDRTDIENISRLARLAVADKVIPDYLRDLGNILALVEQMNSLDTGNIEPLAHPLEIKARFREDRVTESNQRDKFQQIAPAVDNGHYLVPKVIE